MAATVVDDTDVDSYAQQTSLGCFRVHNDCKYKNEIKMKLLSTSAEGGEGELLDILELLHCFMSAHRSYKKLRILHHCPKGVSLGL